LAGYDSLEVSEKFHVKPEILYQAWLDGKEHSAFTGGNEAEIDPVVGGEFTAWGGYIPGKMLELDPPRRILQEWKTSDFGSKDGPSLLEVLFVPEGKGTKLTIKHTRIPKGKGKGYEEGWVDFYFKPMKEYFRSASRRKE
jgi:activator of HSP90 ATPase